MRNLLKNERTNVSGGNINISYNKNQAFVSLSSPYDSVLFNGIGLGWLGWSKGTYNNQNIVVTETEYNGYKIFYSSGQTVTFLLTKQ